MKIAFLFNIAPRWGNCFEELHTQIEKEVVVEKEFFVVNPTLPDSLESHLKTIIEGPFDRIAIFAGDGTLNRVINSLKEHQALNRFSLMIFPFGTCNDFAKNFGLVDLKMNKKVLDETLQSLTQGDFRMIQLAQVNGHYFINNAGFGRREPSKKRWGPLWDVLALKPVPMHIGWDQESLQESFLMMVCANGAYFSNGFHFSKNSDPGDNILEFFFVKPVNKVRLLSKLFLGWCGFPLLPEDMHSNGMTLKIDSSALEIKSETPIWIMTDGERVPSLSGIYQAHFSIAEQCRFIVPFLPHEN
jgi:diacylglycerol kinase family enzyme